ncbi:MAG: cysteine synthase A [Thermoanaerobacteraceae bacterium]
MIVNHIYELIGKTPVIKINKLVGNDYADIYLKLESYNPGNSVKDRVAYSMIEVAEKEGILKKDSIIVEPTSGNTGIGLAMIGAAKGYKVIIVMPDTMSIERRKLLEAYGAEVILSPGNQGMDGAIKIAEEIVKKSKKYFMPQQFKNEANPLIHEKTTAQEILSDFSNGLDVFIAGIGTGGTITGVGRVLKKKMPNIKIVGVEPSSSAIISGGKAGPHNIQGIGAGFIPEIFDKNILDSVISVSDEDAFCMAQKLAKEEGILVGISTGAAFFAAINIAKEIGRGKKVLVIAPDSGERYLSTSLFIKE